MVSIPDKIRAIMKATGKKQMQIAEFFEVSQSTVNRWIAGAEPEGHRRDAINEAYERLVDEGPKESSGTIVPIMGFIGAGGEIAPEFEQAPPEGLEQVWIPFELDDELVAFEVRGISMMPVYREGHVIVCYKEQKRPIDYFFGLDAAVMTADGRRFLKTIMRAGSSIDLHSFNADPIHDVRIEWIGEIFAAMPRSSVKRIERKGGIQGRLSIA
ncbi:S24 family peptidase [Rhizobium laguerreae]|uniref:S24 family peptidase n=1 Tax=Rhizobium laguerreae TaxID=1076926 RepID=UPI00144208A0|nr:S24 family peptidase [Rhizobium laguerreae]NKM69195.1 XRE family transcriptional regulator [Rhizobium laguerreae]